MLANDRKKIILAELHSKGSVTIDDLCDLTEASVSTLRRDLNELEELGRLIRVHGGAEPISSVPKEPSIYEKNSINVHEKLEIANIAVSKVNEGDVIFLDAGTTTGMMIEGLLELEKSFTVVTNSATHASKLISDKITVYIIGGIIKKLTDAVVGSYAIQQINQFNFTKAFIGANAISAGNISTPDIEEANIKRIACEQSAQTYILADKSKFNQVSFGTFAQTDDVEIITNK